MNRIDRSTPAGYTMARLTTRVLRAGIQEGAMHQFPRPRVVVSRCLTFDHCRWNGAIISSEIVELLKPHVDFAPVCPEVEIGLGVPRDPINVVSENGELRLLQPATGRDVSQEMRAFAANYLDGIGVVDGFILKSRSPSCGIKDVKIHAAGRSGPAATGAGFFGAAVLERFPHLPVEDEGRLTNFALREHFLTRLFTLARFRQVRNAGAIGALVEFQTRNKLLLMAYHQERMRAMGRILAAHGRLPAHEVFAQYERELWAALGRMPRRTAYINVWMHAFGYVSQHLTSQEKAYFLGLLDTYRAGKVPVSVPIHVMRAWIVRFQEPYLMGQTCFEPYPPELVEITDSGQGRKLKG